MPPEWGPALTRYYRVALLSVVVCVGAHLGLAALFWMLGVGQLAWINVASIAAWLVSGALLSRHRLRAAFFLCVAEILAHAVAATVVLGWAPGFHVYLIVFGALMLTLPWPRLGPAMFAALHACWIALYLATRHQRPWLALEPGTSDLLMIANFVAAGGGAAIAIYAMRAVADRAEAKLSLEHARSERLLRNILPGPIADRLKQGDEAIADGVDEASVLFCDLVGFTALSARVPPAKLVDLLNEVFSRIDELVERRGLEKIKTIGDAYMVASGLPTPRRDHAETLADLALDLLRMIADYGAAIGLHLQVRIGIHSGPLVAGVIGRSKFAYDLWGDTVNTASRMESHGEPGRIQVTGETWERLRGEFDLEPRGTIEVKGRGAMQAYFLLGRKAPRAGG